MLDAGKLGLVNDIMPVSYSIFHSLLWRSFMYSSSTSLDTIKLQEGNSILL